MMTILIRRLYVRVIAWDSVTLTMKGNVISFKIQIYKVVHLNLQKIFQIEVGQCQREKKMALQFF